MTTPNVETFRGATPKCRHCGKPLKPNYETVKERCFGTSGSVDQPSGEKLIPIDPDVYETSPPDDPKKKTEIKTRDGETWRWSIRKQAWFKVEKVYRIKSRKFKGTFGARGDSYFCMTECGYRFAVRLLRKDSGS